MCGIYGSTKLYTKEQVENKLNRIRFRGPDKSQHLYINDRLVLGHNRLSIIDLDERSNQPFTYAEKIHIVFNGEIYNFQSLKKTLKNEGYLFRTTSDTEVICAAYMAYGKNCITKFNGMFAFVIYDERTDELFGARDRLGQKPLYYYFDNHTFEFASQISAIQLHNANLSISKKAISYYLAWGNIPDPYSIFNEIKKLKAGHTFTYNLQNKKYQEECYWDISIHPKNRFSGTFSEATEILETTLKDAVKIRLFADVPVGVFLSGGVDSSTIAALATKTTSSKVKTFSVKFNEKGFDESIYAEKVAKHLQTDHHVIECNYNEGISLIEDFCHYFDEPFADSSAIPSMLLSKHTRKHVTVALSGDAGDENFIGYQRYAMTQRGAMLYHLPTPVRKSIAGLLKITPHYKLKTLGEALHFKTVNEVYLAAMTGVNLDWITEKDSFLDVSERKYLEHNHKNLLERISGFDLKTYLNWDINTKVDRATMAYSLESRSPLMDYRIVEFAQSLPTHFKMKGSNQKRILKEVLYNHVPKEIFNRPKAGFTMPFSQWFKTELKDFVLSELSKENLENLPGIDAEKVYSKIQQHMNGSWNRYPLIWKLLVLKQWLSTNGKHISIT